MRIAELCPGQRHMRSIITLTLIVVALAAGAQNAIYAYAIGDWRDGPVQMTDLFETTEAFTTPQLIARVKEEYVAFKEIGDIDVLRFATREEGEESQRTLTAKYHVRGILVNMHSADGGKEGSRQEMKVAEPADQPR